MYEYFSFAVAYYNQDTVQIQTIAENVSILVPKPKPRPVLSTRVPATTNTFYDHYQSYGNNNSSAASHSNDYNNNNVGCVVKAGSTIHTIPASIHDVDNATPEELHVVERVEMDIPADTSAHKITITEGLEGEEMDVCSDYVDAPAYPAQYTYTTNDAAMHNTNVSTSQPTYTYPTTTTTTNVYDPTLTSIKGHKYSPNPNIIPTSVPIYQAGGNNNNTLALPAAPQHPVHPHGKDKQQLASTPAAAAVYTKYPPAVNNRRSTGPPQQVC